MHPTTELLKEEMKRKHDNLLKTLPNANTRLHLKLQEVAAG